MRFDETEDGEVFYNGCLCPRTKKPITLYGEYLCCHKPCEYLDNHGWCPWGVRGIEKRKKEVRNSVEFMCGNGICKVKPKGMLWEEVEKEIEKLEQVTIICPCCGEEITDRKKKEEE